VKTVGFEESALRRKSDAVTAMYDAAGENHFWLMHDTFHHYLSGEDIYFPDLTGFVQVSGVENSGVAVAEMRDKHRVLVGHADKIGNLKQLYTLLERRGRAGAREERPGAHIRRGSSSFLA
jgi:2-keto-myo-inositol isomerase